MARALAEHWRRPFVHAFLQPLIGASEYPSCLHSGWIVPLPVCMNRIEQQFALHAFWLASRFVVQSGAPDARPAPRVVVDAVQRRPEARRKLPHGLQSDPWCRRSATGPRMSMSRVPGFSMRHPRGSRRKRSSDFSKRAPRRSISASAAWGCAIRKPQRNLCSPQSPNSECARSSPPAGEALGGEMPLPPNVHVLDEAPHDWLFPRVAVAVHHGGAGTTAAAARAGIPSVVTPFLMDQFFWAKRLEALGLAPGAIRHRKLTAENWRRGSVRHGRQRHAPTRRRHWKRRAG